MEEPEINLLSLPDLLTLRILKELDWKSLMNLKLVCRDFYFLIEKNIGNLDRPKISSLEINFDNGKIQHLHYKLKTDDFFNFESEWKHKYVPEDEKRHNRFLKERDFTEIEDLLFFSDEINECVHVSELNQHENKFYGYLFNIYENNYEYEIGMSSDITIEMSSNRDRRMLWYDPYTKLYVLEEMASLGNNRSKKIAVNFVMDYLTGSPSFGFDSDLIVNEGPLQRDIAAYLLEYGYFDFKGRCSREKIKFNFYRNYESFMFETDFYRELFDEFKSKYNLVEINDYYDSFSIETAMDCRICRTRHINRISSSLFEGIIEII